MVDSGTVDSTEALGAIAGELLGDVGSDVPEFSEAPDAGTPPAPESPDLAETPAAPVEGTEPVEPQGTPPADAPEVPAPDAPPAEPIDPETAFASEPVLTYTVNGVEKPSDIRLVDGAGYIPPSKVADIQRKLGERDHLSATNQTLYRTTQEYQRLGGAPAFEKLKAESEANSAAGMVLMKAIADAFPGPEHAQALKDLFSRAEFEMRKTAFDAGQKFRQDFQVQGQQQDIPAAREQMYNGWFAQAKSALPNLTDADVEEARAIFGGVKTAMFRTATLEDSQKYGRKVGEEIGDPTPMNAWFVKRNEQNAKAQETAKATKLATTANQNRIAAAVRPVARPVVTAPRKAERPEDQKAQDASDAWDLREKLASARLAGTR